MDGVITRGGEERAAHLSVIAAAVVALGFITWVTTPTLGHFENALIPWPTHGLAMAILLVAPAGRRMLVSGLIAGAVAVATTASAVRLDLTLVTVVPAVALLLAQSIAVTLAFDRVAGSRPPLSGTTPYAWLLAVVVAVPVPLVAIADATLAMGGRDVAPAFTATAWWVAASTSGAAIVGGTVMLLSGAPRVEDAQPLVGLEFVLLCVIYATAAASAFAEVGPFAGEVTPALAALPFLVWGGLRFGVRGYAIIATLLIVIVIATTWVDIGPFSRFDEPRIERYRRAWIYLSSLVGPAMIFPVALAERAAAERRSRAAFAQLRAIIEGTSDLIAGVDRDLRIVAANRAWIGTYERLGGKPFREGESRATDSDVGEAERAESAGYWRRAIGGERFTVARTLVDPRGEALELEVTYAPVLDEQGVIVGASHVVRNITERRQREAEEAESRRLESVGRLAGGVAHDFNNLMTAVMGYSELIRASLAPDDPRTADLAEVEKAATRAGELTQQLLAFARRRDVRPRDIDPGETVLGISRLIAPLIGPNITLDVQVSPEKHLIRVDPTQLEQIVMNLAVNARDAMAGGGTLRIETAPDLRAGVRGVRLSVSDSGEGMPPEVIARIFEPFYTTKPVGEGSGLGLATVHGIVHQAGGSIDVASIPGEGTRFDVFFPAVEPAEGA